MRAKRYGVNNKYRGRRSGSAVLKVLIALLAVLLAAGILFIIILGKYIEYTDGGVRLNLPWQQSEESEGLDNSDISDLIITEEPSPSSQPEPGLVELAAVEVTAAEILDGSAAGTVNQASGNALVVTVKDAEGHLAWQSASELAQSAKGSSGETLNGDEAFNQAVQTLSGGEGLYLVARLVCFRDLWMCVYDKSMAMTASSGKLWYDSKGMPWLSPANEDARAYLNSLCQELAELGFDEILLDCAGFPNSGKLSAIAAGENYPADGREDILSQWLAEMSGKLADSGVLLSVQVSQTDLAELGSSSGQTAAVLSLAGRVWLDGTEDLTAWTEKLSQAGLDGAETRLVRILQTAEEHPDGQAGSWAVLLS